MDNSAFGKTKSKAHLLASDFRCLCGSAQLCAAGAGPSGLGWVLGPLCRCISVADGSRSNGGYRYLCPLLRRMGRICGRRRDSGRLLRNWYLFLLGAMIIGQIFAKVGLGKRLSLCPAHVGQQVEDGPAQRNAGDLHHLNVSGGHPHGANLLWSVHASAGEEWLRAWQVQLWQAMMLGIPVAAALGGIGTPAGSGMNAVTMSLLKSICGVEISFCTVVHSGRTRGNCQHHCGLAVLLHHLKPEMDVVKGLDSLKEDRKNIGPLRGDELKFAIVFSVMIVMWFIPSTPVSTCT